MATGAPDPARVLITGGAGFIGSHLAIRLAGTGRHVGVVDDLSSGSKEHLEALVAMFAPADAEAAVDGDVAVEAA